MYENQHVARDTYLTIVYTGVRVQLVAVVMTYVTGQFHEDTDKVKINKYFYFHCKLIALTQTVL